MMGVGNWALAVTWAPGGWVCTALSLAPLRRLWNSSSDLAPDWLMQKFGEN